MAFKSFVAVFVLWTFCSTSVAELTSTQQTQCLNLHNTRRGQVNPAASNMQTMSWNTCIANLAQSHANKCKWQHSTQSFRSNKCNFKYIGENLAYGTGSTYTPANDGHRKLINVWWAERSYYSYSKNTCQSGKMCGHYTQMVWWNSNRLGCAHKKCSFGEFYVCMYGHGGNYVGQRPYKKASKRSIEATISCGEFTCDSNAFCDTLTNTCECIEGFQGNGTSCVPTDNFFLSNFEVALGSEDWILLGGQADEMDNIQKSLAYVGENKEPNIVHWVPSNEYTSPSITIATVKVEIDEASSSDWGLCMRYQDPNNMACFICNTRTNKMMVSVIYSGKEVQRDFNIPCNFVVGENETYNTISIADRNSYFQIHFNDERVGPTIQIPFWEKPGGLALRSIGTAAFYELSVLTRKQLIITLVNCVSANEFRQKLATILGIDVAYIQNVVVSDTCQSGSFQVTFTIEGNNDLSSEQLYGRLRNLINVRDSSLSENGLEVFALSEAPAESAPSDTVKFELFTENSIPQTIALGIGVVIGIAIGVAVTVAIVGLASKKTYQYYKLRGSVAIEYNSQVSKAYADPGISGNNPFFENPSTPKDVPLQQL